MGDLKGRSRSHRWHGLFFGCWTTGYQMAHDGTQGWSHRTYMAYGASARSMSNADGDIRVTVTLVWCDQFPDTTCLGLP